MARTVTLLSFLILAAPSPAAHPVPINTYDRTITVRLTPKSVVVEYLLEVDAETAFNDVPDLVSNEEFKQLTRAELVYAGFARGTVKRLMAGMVLRLDGQELPLTCKQQSHKVLDHLRCEYQFEAVWEPAQNSRHEVTFREGNFFEEKGSIRLS